MPPHSYDKKRDNSQTVVWEKTHRNGETTEVQADRVGTEEAGTVDWLVNISDPNGNQRLGRFENKKEARKAASRWMSNHPKGVEGAGGVFGV